MNISIIVAVAHGGVIGKDNQLLWKIPEDMKWFRTVTTGHPVIMGRKTYESIGRPLPKRTNIVITRDPLWQAEGVTVVHSLDEALLRYTHSDEEIFVIGGGEIYKQSLPIAQTLYVTHVDRHYEGDTFFPEIDSNTWQQTWTEEHTEDDTPYRFSIYKKTPSI